MIFGPMLQVGWASACVDGDLGQVGGGATAERAAAGRQHDAAQLAAGRHGGAQALVDGAVLGVDRHQLGARRRPQRLHHRPGGDQRLLVGQRQPLAGPQGLEGDRQAGEADDAVHHHVGVGGQVGEVADHLRERQRLGHLGPARRIGHRDDLGPELEGLGDQDLGRRADTEADDLVAVPFGPHDVEGLGADRAGRPSHRNPDGAHRPSLSASLRGGRANALSTASGSGAGEHAERSGEGSASDEPQPSRGESERQRADDERGRVT